MGSPSGERQKSEAVEEIITARAEMAFQVNLFFIFHQICCLPSLLIFLSSVLRLLFFLFDVEKYLAINRKLKTDFVCQSQGYNLINELGRFQNINEGGYGICG